MSQILDALRRVEMQMRQAADQTTPEGVLANLELTPTSEEVFTEVTDGTPPDYEELVALYSSLLNTVSRVRAHVAIVIKEERDHNQAQQNSQSEEIARLQEKIQSLETALLDKTHEAVQADLRLKQTINRMAQWLRQWESVRNPA